MRTITKELFHNHKRVFTVNSIYGPLFVVAADFMAATDLLQEYAESRGILPYKIHVKECNPFGTANGYSAPTGTFVEVLTSHLCDVLSPNIVYEYKTVVSLHIEYMGYHV